MEEYERRKMNYEKKKREREILKGKDEIKRR